MDLVDEKMVFFGIEGLTDKELLKYLFGDNKFSQELCEKIQNIQQLVNFTPGLIYNLKNATSKKCKSIEALVELIKRGNSDIKGLFGKYKLSGAKQVAKIYQTKIGKKKVETVHLLLLNRKHELVKEMLFSTGTVQNALINVVDVLHEVVKYCCYDFILVHNHPSQDVTPSKCDDEVTEQLIKSSKLLGMHFLDHVIVSCNDYYSYGEKQKELFGE